MDVVAAVRKYIDQMAADCGFGMKILLMDRETTSIVSLAYAQSEVLQKEIYMFELLDSRNREIMKHLNAIPMAVNNNIFTFNITPAVAARNIWADGALGRVTGGVASVLLALKRKPVIRYVAGSRPAEQLAREVARVYQNHNRQFVFRQPDNPPLLLILDRHNDPVTPLLNQWTYQAMIHEMLGLKNNRVTSLTS